MSYLMTTRLTSPVVEPVTLDEMKMQLRIDNDESDLELSAMISAAREHIEAYTWRYWAECSVVIEYSKFPYADNPIYLPHLGIQSIDQIKYLDEDDDPQTLSISPATYSLDTDYNRITNTASWPAYGYGIRITSTIGETCPAAIKQAIMMHVVSAYEHRGAQSTLQIYDNKAALMMAHPYRRTAGL